jgi:hypothetical protein
MSDEKKEHPTQTEHPEKDEPTTQSASDPQPADGGGIPIEPGKTGDEQPTEPNE